MNAPTASSADQPATASESRPATEELAPVAGTAAGAPSAANPAAPGVTTAGVTTPGVTTAGVPAAGAPTGGAEPPAGAELPPPQSRPPGFRERARMRRRVRFLRKVRELAYRDLGGLVFEMQRSRQRNDELVAAKLGVLAAFDTELRTLESALGERRPLTVLREAGIAACPRCAAIHGSDDRFCPMCGMPFGRPEASPVAATPPLTVAAPATATAASIAAATTVTPGQLPLSAPAAKDDRPTEIIRPPDDAR